MATRDWFRKSTWTPADQAEFHKRLGRSRGGSSKAQYATIQAGHLQQAGTPELHRAALDLLNLVLSEWQKDAMLAQVYAQRANSLKALGDVPAALSAFRQAFEEQRRFPGMITHAHHDFAWWVATTPFPELFDEALKVLDEFDPHPLPLPSNLYSLCGAKALICAGKGELARAREYAQQAISAAERKESGLRYHRQLGLVKEVDQRIDESLKRLAKSR